MGSYDVQKANEAMNPQRQNYTDLSHNDPAEQNEGSSSKLCPPSEATKYAMKQCLAEFIGVAIYVFIGGLSTRPKDDVMIYAVVHGLTMIMILTAIGHLSGGHVNPVVTLGLLLQGSSRIVPSICYWLSQILGAIFGAALILAVLWSEKYFGISGGAIPVNIGDGGAAVESQIVIMELILTGIMMYIVLMTAVDRDDNALAPVAIGLSIFVGMIVSKDVTGGCMNPARSFGPLVIYSAATPYFGNETQSYIAPYSLWRTHYIHWLGPLVGAAIAALIYRFLFSTKKRS